MSTLGVMNCQKWEPFSGSPGIKVNLGQTFLSVKLLQRGSITSAVVKI